MAINPSGDPRLKGVRTVPKMRPASVNVKTLTIDRAMWLTGEWQLIVRSALRHKSGMMCCLGFFCKRLGLTNSEITNITIPNSVRALLPINQLWLTLSGGTVQDLMDTNDEDALSRKEREKAIKAGFAEQGITVKFKGRYPTAAQVKQMVGDDV